MKASAAEDYIATVSVLAKGTGINLLGTVGRGALIYLHSFVVAKLIGAQNYGLYSIGLALVTIVGVAG